MLNSFRSTSAAAFRLMASARRNPTTSTSLRTMSTDPSSYLLSSTALRVADITESLNFYTQILGLSLIETVQNNGSQSYLLGYDTPDSLSYRKPYFRRQGLLQLQLISPQPDFNVKVENGNSDPYRGFGHVCISVDNIQAVENLLLSKGVAFKKKLADGRQKDIAFFLDPNGYWIELIENSAVSQSVQANETKVENYRFNHTMVRVKDIDLSLKFYRALLGMKLFEIKKFPDAKFDLYFLGFSNDSDFKEGDAYTGDAEGMLELTYNYDSEKDPDFKYYDGHEKDDDGIIGYSHIGIRVDNAKALTNKLKKEGIQLVHDFQENSSLVKDPDGYWVEILNKVPNTSAQL